MKKIMLSFLAALFLMFSEPLFAVSVISAQEAPFDPALKISHQFAGIVSALSDTAITVSDKENSYTFKIDDKTRINGKIATGKKVSVVYAYLKIFKAYLVKKALIINVVEEKKT